MSTLQWAWYACENGNTRYNGKEFKCTICGKRLSCITIIKLFNKQIGTDWEIKVKLSIGRKGPEQTTQKTATNYNAETDTEGRTEQRQRKDRTPISHMTGVENEPHIQNNEKVNTTVQLEQQTDVDNMEGNNETDS